MLQIKRVTTSIKIEPDLWKKAKVESINRDMDLSQFVELAIKNELKNKH